MNRHRNAKRRASLPHRIKSRVVHFDQFARRVAHHQSEVLQHLQATRARLVRGDNLIRLRLGVARLAHLSVGGLRKRQEPPRVRAVEGIDVGFHARAHTAREIHQRPDVAPVHDLQHLLGRSREGYLFGSPAAERQVGVDINHRVARPLHPMLFHHQHALRLKLLDIQWRRLLGLSLHQRRRRAQTC